MAVDVSLNLRATAKRRQCFFTHPRPQGFAGLPIVYLTRSSADRLYSPCYPNRAKTASARRLQCRMKVAVTAQNNDTASRRPKPLNILNEPSDTLLACRLFACHSIVSRRSREQRAGSLEFRGSGTQTRQASCCNSGISPIPCQPLCAFVRASEMGARIGRHWATRCDLCVPRHAITPPRSMDVR